MTRSSLNRITSERDNDPMVYIGRRILARPICREEFVSTITSKLRTKTNLGQKIEICETFVIEGLDRLINELNEINIESNDYIERKKEIELDFYLYLADQINNVGINKSSVKKVRRNTRKSTSKVAKTFDSDSEQIEEVVTVTADDIKSLIGTEVNQFIEATITKERATYAANTIITKGIIHSEEKKKVQKLRKKDIVNSILGLTQEIALKLEIGLNPLRVNTETIGEIISSKETRDFCLQLEEEARHSKQVQNSIFQLIVNRIFELLEINIESTQGNDLYSALYSGEFIDVMNDIVERIINYYKIRSKLDRYVSTLIEYSEEVSSVDIPNVWALRFDEIENTIRESIKLQSERREDYIPIDFDTMYGLPPRDTADVRYLTQDIENSTFDFRKTILRVVLGPVDELRDNDDAEVRDASKKVSENIRYVLFEGGESDEEVNSVVSEALNLLNDNEIPLTINDYQIEKLRQVTPDNKISINLSDRVKKDVLASAASAYREIRRKVDNVGGIELPELDFNNLDRILDTIKSIVIRSEKDFVLVRNTIAALGIIHTTLTVKAKYNYELACEATNSIIRRLATSHSDALTYSKKDGCFAFKKFPDFKLYIAEAKSVESVIRKMIAKGYTNDGLDSTIIEKIVKDHCRFTITVPDKYFLIGDGLPYGTPIEENELARKREIEVLGMVKAILEELVPILGTEFYNERFKVALGNGSMISRYSTGQRMSVQMSCDVRVLKFGTGDKDKEAEVACVPTEIAIIPESQRLNKDCNDKHTIEKLTNERDAYERNNCMGVVRNLGLTRTYTEYFDTIAARALYENVFDGVYDPVIEQKILEISQNAAFLTSSWSPHTASSERTETSKYFIYLHNMLTGVGAEKLYDHIKVSCIKNPNTKVLYTKLSYRIDRLCRTLRETIEKKGKNYKPSSFDLKFLENLSDIVTRLNDAVNY